jgi:hypothetical protein
LRSGSDYENILLTILALLVLGSLVFVLSITRDGELITPIGAGTITIDGRSYEAFPLPDYAAEFVTDDYKSYFVEVEPGIKIHMLEVGTGLAVYLQHGNPTSGFLYRKVVNELRTRPSACDHANHGGFGFFQQGTRQ